jgi:hypothetical protein
MGGISRCLELKSVVGRRLYAPASGAGVMKFPKNSLMGIGPIQGRVNRLTLSVIFLWQSSWAALWRTTVLETWTSVVVKSRKPTISAFILFTYKEAGHKHKTMDFSEFHRDWERPVRVSRPHLCRIIAHDNQARRSCIGPRARRKTVRVRAQLYVSYNTSFKPVRKESP